MEALWVACAVISLIRRCFQYKFRCRARHLCLKRSILPQLKHALRLRLEWLLRPQCLQATRIVLLGTEDARFRIAAEGPWRVVSKTKTAEIGARGALRGGGFGGTLSDKIWEQLQCWCLAKSGFCTDLLPGTLGSLVLRRGSCSFSGRWTKCFKRSQWAMGSSWFAVFLILEVTVLGHRTAVYGHFHGDECLVLSFSGNQELCYQTLSLGHAF